MGSDAVIDSGTKKVVFVSLGEGKFEPREIEAGATDGDHVEVRSGLEQGEQVVACSSRCSPTGRRPRWRPPPGGGEAQPAHG